LQVANAFIRIVLILLRGKLYPRKIAVSAGIFTLAFAVLACAINIGGPAYPTPVIPISTEAVGELQSSLETAVTAGSISGMVTLAFSESQITSYLYYKLLAQTQSLIKNPQVYLREGQLQVYGTATEGNLEATVRIILNAGVDDQGQLSIGLVSADFGPLPLPDELKEIITATIKEAFTGALGPVATGIRLQSVTISDGTMTIVGQIK
jgi:hypothetical protein